MRTSASVLRFATTAIHANFLKKHHLHIWAIYHCHMSWSHRNLTRSLIFLLLSSLITCTISPGKPRVFKDSWRPRFVLSCLLRLIGGRTPPFAAYLLEAVICPLRLLSYLTRQTDDDCLLATILLFALSGTWNRRVPFPHIILYIPWGWVGQTMFIFWGQARSTIGVCNLMQACHVCMNSGDTVLSTASPISRMLVRTWWDKFESMANYKN